MGIQLLGSISGLSIGACCEHTTCLAHHNYRSIVSPSIIFAVVATASVLVNPKPLKFNLLGQLSALRMLLSVKARPHGTNFGWSVFCVILLTRLLRRAHRVQRCVKVPSPERPSTQATVQHLLILVGSLYDCFMHFGRKGNRKLSEGVEWTPDGHDILSRQLNSTILGGSSNVILRAYMTFKSSRK